MSLKTRRDFQVLARLRTREARALVRTGNEQGAYYLAGFAVECALKACIAKKTRRYDFPRDQNYAKSVYTHDLGELLKLAGLNAQFDSDSKVDAALGANWGVVKGWTVASRYETTGLRGRDMLKAVTSRQGGVLKWIRNHW
jgi:HEPN domain-containing protein